MITNTDGLSMAEIHLEQGHAPHDDGRKGRLLGGFETRAELVRYVKHRVNTEGRFQKEVALELNISSASVSRIIKPPTGYRSARGGQPPRREPLATTLNKYWRPTTLPGV